MALVAASRQVSHPQPRRATWPRVTSSRPEQQLACKGSSVWGDTQGPSPLSPDGDDLQDFQKTQVCQVWGQPKGSSACPLWGKGNPLILFINTESRVRVSWFGVRHKNLTYRNDCVAKVTVRPEEEQTSEQFLTGTRKHSEDYLSSLIWFKKTLPSVNRKRKPQNWISRDEGTTGWDEKRTGDKRGWSVLEGYLLLDYLEKCQLRDPAQG